MGEGASLVLEACHEPVEQRLDLWRYLRGA
jgi:hypothetical protein